MTILSVCGSGSKSRGNTSGVVLLTALILISIVSIFAIGIFHILTSQTRIAEHEIKRILASYTAQAALWGAYMDLYEDGQLNWEIPDDGNPDTGFVTIPTNMNFRANILRIPGAGINGTDQVVITVNY